MIHKAEREQKLSMIGLMNWAEKMMTSDDLDDEIEIRLETDENAVKIMTIHVAKGLEFPIVFCPFSWKGNPSKEVVFHRNDEIVVDLGSKDI